MGKRYKHEHLSLTYSHEGNNCFVVRFDPNDVEVIQREKEVRFICKTDLVRIEII